MRFEQLEQILKIDEYRSVSKAANALFISQPSLSVSVSRLEEELGIKIFERSSAGVVPSEQGEVVLELAKYILDLNVKIKGIMDEENVPIHNLHMAIPGVCANAIVPDLLMEFHSLHPKVSLHIHEAPYYEIVESMDKGAYSIGIIICDPEGKSNLLKQLKEVDIEGEIISGSQTRLLTFLSSKNPLAARECLRAADLKNMRLISYKENYVYASKIIGNQLNKPIIVEDIELLKKLISDDYGFSIFPEILAYNDLYISSGMIKAIPIQEFSEQWNVFILSTPYESLSFVEKELLALVKKMIKENMIDKNALLRSIETE